MSSITTGYNVSYRDMKGVDFSGSSDKRSRYAYLENMYRDYDGDGSIESVPGFRKIASLGEKIHAIYEQKNSYGTSFTVVHAGTNIYRFPTDERDNLSNITSIGRIENKKSSAFRFGYDLYILDGKKILKISEGGSVELITSESSSVYVPTTYYNEQRLEQRNLLASSFKEKYLIGASETVIYGTHGLLYRITNEALGLCAVAGIEDGFRGILNIPSYTRIGNKKYKVDEIADNAFFENTGILGLKIGIGIYRIGKYAFSNCTALSSIEASGAATVIDSYAFKGCSRLNTLFLGTETEIFGESVFEGCTSLSAINYASAKNEFLKIENSDSLAHLEIYTFKNDFSITAEIPIKTPTDNILSVTLGEKKLNNFSTVTENGIVTSILFNVDDRRKIEGKEVTITASQNNSLFKDEERGDFISDTGYTQNVFSAICECTVCESFDGRIFLSGNPSLAGTVFYSSRDVGSKNAPLYFGAYNYFRDGFGAFGVSSMLASSNFLLVFKKSDDGGGSIFYHTPKETSDDFISKTYPVTYTHNGIGAVGASFSFFDDPVFVSRYGISAIDKQTINLERSIACRSHNVNPELLSEPLEEISLAQWCGYLAVGVNGSIYLADSRATFIHESGSKEYEWYYMPKVGTYKNDTRVYRYTSTAHSGYTLHPDPEKEALGTVYSESVNGKTVYYSLEKGIKYEVYPTEERDGGIFSPLTVINGFEGDILFFGTENGDLCVFNNDKRGIAPTRISSASDFSYADYKKVYGRRIHPDFYSFDAHKMRCGVKTNLDDCGYPSITKNTVKHSFTLKCKISGRGQVRCEVKTDSSGYEEYIATPNTVPDFSDWSFESLALTSEDSITLPISEKEKNWIEKEIAVYCESFCSPIAVYSLTYRYTPKGRIKHK